MSVVMKKRVVPQRISMVKALKLYFFKIAALVPSKTL